MNMTFQIRLPILLWRSELNQSRFTSRRRTSLPHGCGAFSLFEVLPLNILHHLWIMDQTARRYQVCHKPPQMSTFLSWTRLTARRPVAESDDFCPVRFVYPAPSHEAKNDHVIAPIHRGRSVSHLKWLLQDLCFLLIVFLFIPSYSSCDRVNAASAFTLLFSFFIIIVGPIIIHRIRVS